MCSPPREIINSECVCPNNQIYTSSGECVASGSNPSFVPSSISGDFGFGSNTNTGVFTPSTGSNVCSPPRLLINGRCSCPDNGVFLSGRCYRRDSPNDLYPVEPIMNTTDPNSKEALAKIFREYNGTNNNRANPLWGSKDVPLERRAPNSYHFNETTGRFEVRQDLPNPRNISNIAGNLVGNPVRSRLNVTMAFVIWGQFLDHDIDLTEAS